MPSANPSCPLVLWTVAAHRHLRHDLVFMTLERGNADGPLAGLVYGDAQQFLGDVPVVYLESAFLGAVLHGSPSPAAVADTLVQLSERIGHLLYRQSFVDDPADTNFVLNVPRLEESFPVWSQPGSEPVRACQDVNTWTSPEGDRAWESGDLVTTENRFLQAREEYKRGYALRHGHYPGINEATMLLLLAALAWQHKGEPRSLDYLHQAEAVADDVLARRDHWPKDFSDDNIWHPATAGEANLLKRNWSEAASQYAAALREANVQPSHRQSIGKPARRILDALALLDVRPEPPFDNPDDFFGPLPRTRLSFVLMRTLAMNYVPKPVDTTAVKLPDDLRELTERLAENAHDVWARRKIADGWTWGPTVDAAGKKHPDLIAYEQLPDDKKEYNRDTAMETIKAILSLGYTISKPGSIHELKE